jgi:PAS domain S-box-containing protein
MSTSPPANGSEVDRLQAEIARLSAELDRERAAGACMRDWLERASDAAWRFELDQPLDVDAPEDAQIDHIYRHAWLAHCNDATVRMYGFERADEVRGARLGTLLDPTDPRSRELLRAFVRSGYRLSGAESHALDRDGRSRWFSNDLVGVADGGRLTSALGTRRDISDRKQLEEDLRQAMKREALATAVRQALDRT